MDRAYKRAAAALQHGHQQQQQQQQQQPGIRVPQWGGTHLEVYHQAALITYRSHTCVLDGRETVCNNGETRNAKRQQAAYARVMQRHLLCQGATTWQM
jgi:hypothetical protein